jgi:hypothetical protein
MLQRNLSHSGAYTVQDFICLFIAEQSFSYPSAVSITEDGIANTDLCLALVAFSSEGSFTCHTCCDTEPEFIQFIRRTSSHVPQQDSNLRRKDNQILFDDPYAARRSKRYTTRVGNGVHWYTCINLHVATCLGNTCTCTFTVHGDIKVDFYFRYIRITSSQSIEMLKSMSSMV